MNNIKRAMKARDGSQTPSLQCTAMARRSGMLLLLVLSCWTPRTLSFQPSARPSSRRANDIYPRDKCTWALLSSRGSAGVNVTAVVPLYSKSETYTSLANDMQSSSLNLTSVVSLASKETSPSLPSMQSSVTDEGKMVFIMTGLLWGTAFLSALDRVAMSVAILPLSQEFGFSETVKGSISSLFSVGYGLAIIPCGLIAGSQSPRIIMSAGLVIWSLATIFTPIAINSSLGSLLMARAVVGAAESAILPTIQRLVSSWIPPAKRSLTLATILTGFQAGSVAAYLLSPIVMEELGGWRGLFIVYGAVGLLWLVPWMALARDAPATSTEMESSMASPVGETKTVHNSLEDALHVIKSAPWTEFAKSPAVWSMTLAHAANNWGLYNSLAWTPTFYAEQYGLNIKDSALLSVLPSVAGAVGGLIAGSTADALIRNLGEGAETTTIRKAYQGVALFGPALCLATLSSHIPEQPWVAQCLLGLGLGLQAFNAGGYVSANQEKAGPKWTGLLYSITSLPGVIFGSFGVYFTGQILDMTRQDWSTVFGLNACVNLLGATAFLAFYNSKREFD